MRDPERFAALKVQAAASKPHGVRARYNAGCRCDLCRAVNNAYEKRRNKLRHTFDYNGLVPADISRAYLKRLSRQGIGRHSVAAVSGISGSILYGIITGERRNCRARTERRILAVDPRVARAGGSLVPAQPAWHKLDQLIRDGYTRSFLAGLLGSKAKTPQLQLRRDWITYANAVAVDKLVLRIEQGRVRRPDDAATDPQAGHSSELNGKPAAHSSGGIERLGKPQSSQTRNGGL
jgi:hypothetical protein